MRPPAAASAGCQARASSTRRRKANTGTSPFPLLLSDGSCLSEHLLPRHALHVVDSFRALLHGGHQLSLVVSKLRQKLGSLGLDRDRIIPNAFRCYQLRPPPDTWIDLEAAAEAVHQAEGALIANQPQAAYGPALIAATIARRLFLVGEDSPWIAACRQRQRDLLVRALDCRVAALLANGEVALALDQARAAVELEPYRESGYRRLMQVLVKQGDRGEAIRVYNECRRLLADELGVTPSSETESLRRSLAG